MKCFYLWRTKDDSGVSGTGRVAQGFVADNGKVSLFWLSEHPSVTIYDNIGEVKAIHGHSGSTEVRMEPDFKRAFHELKSAMAEVTLMEVAANRLPPEGAAQGILKQKEPEKAVEEK